ncbi:hypothetical protein [Streptomyces sp. JV178]|jgi:hypothetical protein|uniref:hypothetical protein n=1 Tax=Streptomyces sp. JV178 TaxID=858632 RepID=UPI00211E578E|nr:hypothetical protein [Streptomyces sp. JV178]
MKNVEPRTPLSDVPAAEHWPTPGHPAPSAQSASECDLVTVPARQGLEAVDILRRGALDVVGPVMTVGPVLHDDACDTLGFLVPPGTADAWDVPGSTCTQSDGRGAVLAPADGADWLLPPGEADLATDPAVLRAALGEAARMIEAADNCR